MIDPFIPLCELVSLYFCLFLCIHSCPACFFVSESSRGRDHSAARGEQQTGTRSEEENKHTKRRNGREKCKNYIRRKSTFHSSPLATSVQSLPLSFSSSRIDFALCSLCGLSSFVAYITLRLHHPPFADSVGQWYSVDGLRFWVSAAPPSVPSQHTAKTIQAQSYAGMMMMMIMIMIMIMMTTSMRRSMTNIKVSQHTRSC